MKLKNTIFQLATAARLVPARLPAVSGILSFFFLSTLVAASVHCGGETYDKAADTVWSDAAYKAAYVARHRQAAYEIEDVSVTREEAALKVLNAFCEEDGDPGRWIFNEREHREILWPNLPAADDPGATNNPDAYWDIIQTLTGVVWPRMQAWRGSCMELIRMPYRRDPEQYGNLVLHYPGEIEVRFVNTGKKARIEFIRTIVEHRNQFKVGQVGPD